MALGTGRGSTRRRVRVRVRGGPSLLIRAPKTGLSAADELKARNDVRTTLVQALAGLAVAGGLVVTYRTYQQNRMEQNRTYEQHQQEQDRTYERELYAKAVEQLGHEKAPVRLGALYSLERLAEDKPERRQIIVDVICAYLRMPFSPTAPAIKPEPEATEAPEMPAAETERRTEETGDTWQQERQVRLTAQDILARHLRDDGARDKRSTDPPGPDFWPDIRLNLAGATLIDFNLVKGVMADANFGGATFTGLARFDWATFSGRAMFGGATFSGGAWFGGATFTGGAGFGGASFTGDAGFGEATFTGDARFDGATFSSQAWFGEATFSGRAEFGGATFTGRAGFGRTTFTGRAAFDGATFTGRTGFGRTTFTDDAMFGGATFSGDARFDGATFSGDAWFGGTTFTGGAGFGGATFTGDAWFGGATFSGRARFNRATFIGGDNSLSFDQSIVTRPDVRHVWPTGWCLEADGSGGNTVVRADDGLDTGLKPEDPSAAGTAGGA